MTRWVSIQDTGNILARPAVFGSKPAGIQANEFEGSKLKDLSNQEKGSTPNGVKQTKNEDLEKYRNSFRV